MPTKYEAGQADHQGDSLLGEIGVEAGGMDSGADCRAAGEDPVGRS